MPEQHVTDKSEMLSGTPVTQEEFTRIAAVCEEIARLRDHKFDPRHEEIKKAINYWDGIVLVTKRTGFPWPSGRPLKIGKVGADIPLPVDSFRTKYSLVNGLLLAPAAQIGLGWKKQPRIRLTGDHFELVWGEIDEAQAEPRKRPRKTPLPNAFDPEFRGVPPASTMKIGRVIRIVILEGLHGRSYWDLFIRGASTTAELWGVDLIPVSINAYPDRVNTTKALLNEILSRPSPQSVHGILACSTAHSITESFLPAAKEKGIVLLETSYSDSRIRTDKLRWAKLMCESIAAFVSKMSKPPTIVVIEDGTREHDEGIISQRRDKLIQLLTKPPGKRPVVEPQQLVCLKTDTTFKGVSTSLVHWLSENSPKYEIVVIALTTEMTTGVLNAVLQLPLTVRKKLSVYGTDFGSRTVWEFQETNTPLRAVVGIDPFRVGQYCLRAMLSAIGQLSEGVLEAIPPYVVRPVLLTSDDAKREQITCANDIAEIRPELRLWDERSCWPPWMAEVSPKALWNLSSEEETERKAERQEVLRWISRSLVHPA